MATIEDWVKAYQREGMKYANGATSGGINDVDITSLQGDQLNIYNKDRYIYDSYVRAAQELERNKTQLGVEADNRKQQAYIGSEYAKKYLPQQQKANGTYGLGTSETAKLNIMNNYRNNVNGIDNNIGNRKNQLSTSFNDYTNTLNSQAMTNQVDNQRYIEGLKRAAKAAEYGKQLKAADTNIDDLLSQITQDQQILGDYYTELYQDAWGRKWTDNKSKVKQELDNMLLEYGNNFLDDGRMTWQDYSKIMDYANSVKGGLHADDYNSLFNNFQHESEDEYNSRVGAEKHKAISQLDNDIKKAMDLANQRTYYALNPGGYGSGLVYTPKPYTSLPADIAGKLTQALNSGYITEEEYASKQREIIESLNNYLNQAVTQKENKYKSF